MSEDISYQEEQVEETVPYVRNNAIAEALIANAEELLGTDAPEMRRYRAQAKLIEKLPNLHSWMSDYGDLENLTIAGDGTKLRADTRGFAEKYLLDSPLVAKLWLTSDIRSRQVRELGFESSDETPDEYDEAVAAGHYENVVSAYENR